MRLAYKDNLGSFASSRQDNRPIARENVRYDVMYTCGRPATNDYSGFLLKSHPGFGVVER